MKITFYKKCVLSKAYQNVYATQTRLNTYLETLQSKEITLNTVYPKFTDEFIITNSDFTIMEYNYLKIDYEYEDTQNNFTLYMFIDKIEIMNKVAKVFVSMDYWHSYWEQVNFHKGILQTTTMRGLETKYSHIQDFETNKNFRISKQENSNYVYLICDVQVYTLVSGEVEPTFIQPLKILIARYDTGNLQYYTHFGDVNDIMGYVIALQSGKYFGVWDDTIGSDPDLVMHPYYFKIVNTYVIPHFMLKNKINTADGITADRRITFIHDPNSGIPSLPFVITGYILTFTFYDEMLLYDYTVVDDEMVFAVGGMTYSEPKLFNGHSEKISYYLYFDCGSLYLYMRINNKKIDITENYKYNLLYNSVTAEEQQLRELNLSTSKLSTALSGSVEEFMGVVSGIIGVALMSNPATEVLGVSMLLGGASSVAGSMNNWVEYDKLNQVPYSSFIKGVGIKNNALLNAISGICIYTKKSNAEPESIDGIYNYLNVKSIEKEYGYNVDNYLTYLKPNYQEFVKFKSIEISGLNENILNNIRNILLNGVRIWTNGTIQ